MHETAEMCFNHNMGVHDSGYVGNQAHLQNPVEWDRDEFQELLGRTLHSLQTMLLNQGFSTKNLGKSHLPKLIDMSLNYF